jgi:hypothetical protein
VITFKVSIHYGLLTTNFRLFYHSFIVSTFSLARSDQIKWFLL